MGYSTRADIEAMFGVVNVSKWADLDGDQNATKITNRIAATIAAADAELDARLRGGVVILPIAAPYDPTIVDLSARMAGVRLYEARGVADIDPVTGSPLHRLSWHRQHVEKTVRDIKAGRLRLTTSRQLECPILEPDEDD